MLTSGMSNRNLSPMRYRVWAMLRAILCLILSVTLLVQPASAQQILRDAETEAFLKDISAPLIKAAGLSPNNVQVLLINDPSINAFVAGGQIVWIHSGLLAAADMAVGLAQTARIA